MIGRRPAATCVPANRAGPAWRTRRQNLPPRTLRSGRIRRRTPNSGSTGPSRRRRAGRRTTAPRGAGSGGVRGRVAIRPAAGTGRRGDRVLRRRSSTPCARRPSSIASGMPSRRRQISTTAAASRRVNETLGATSWARSTNRVAAASPAPMLTSSDGTGQSCSSRCRSPSRLVARIFTVAECGQDRLDQVGGCVQDVFAVVEHQQSRAAFQRGRDALRQRHPWLLRDAEHGCDGVGDGGGIADCGEFDHPYAVGEAVGHSRGRPQAPVGSCPRRRHRSSVTSRCGLERRINIGQFCLAADEAGGCAAADFQAPSRAVCNGGKSVRRPGAWT